VPTEVLPLADVLKQVEVAPEPATGLRATRDLIRELTTPPPLQPTIACPRPGRAPITVGPNSKVGSGARLKAKAASTALGIVGGLVGGGGGGGGKGGPPLMRCRIKDAETTVFTHPESGLAIRVGAKQVGDNVTVFAGIDNAPDAGTFQSTFLQDPGGQVLAPADVGICDLWGEWSLTVSWTRSTYVDGELIKRESGGWAKEGLFSIPGVLSPVDQPDGLWRRLGFSNASHGARQVGAVFPLSAAELAKSPLDFVVHVTRPSEDPVTTVPFVLRMRSTPAGITFEEVQEACDPRPLEPTVVAPRPVLVTLLRDPAQMAPDELPRCPMGDPCTERELRFQRTLDLRRHFEEEFGARTEECAALQAALNAAQKALSDAEAALPAAGALSAEESWIMDAETGRRIDSRDLRLRRSASQKAWQRYKAGEITASELEAEWARLGEDKALDELRKADEQRRIEKLEAAEKLRDAARAARDEAQQRHEAKEEVKGRLRAAIGELDRAADEQFEKLLDCKKGGCEPQPPPSPAAGPTVAGDPRPEPTGTTPPELPPASGTPTQQEDPCYCGPDMAGAMADAANRLQERMTKLPDSEKGAYDGPWFLNRNGDSYDSPPAAIVRPTADPAAKLEDSYICPSPKCTVFKTKTTGRLCGYCLPFHMFNEINASFIAHGVGVHPLVFMAGANARELNQYGSFEGNAPTVAYTIGIALQNLADDGTPITPVSLCDTVRDVMESRTPVHNKSRGFIPDFEFGMVSMWDLVLAEYPHLKDCKECPDPRPGRFIKDFSRNLWTLEDGTKVGQEYELPADSR
jgi:hypothetical protein